MSAIYKGVIDDFGLFMYMLAKLLKVLFFLFRIGFIMYASSYSNIEIDWWICLKVQKQFFS